MLTLVAAVGLLTAGAVSASAVETTSWWALKDTRLVASGYDSKAYGYGKWRVALKDSGTLGLATGYLKIENAANHKAFFVLTNQYNAGRCVSGLSLAFDFRGHGGALGIDYSCAQEYYTDRAVESTRSISYKWDGEPHYASRQVSDGATRARARVKVCLDIPLRNDVCTGHRYSGIDTY